MKIPRISLRLPRRRTRAYGSDARPAGTRIRFFLAGVLLLLISFVAGFYYFFPTGSLRERIEREVGSRTRAELQIGSLSLVFPPGLEGRKVSIKTPSPQLPALDLAAVVLKPLWYSLFSSNPGLGIQADLMGGRVRGTLRRDGSVEAQMDRIAFSEPLAAASSLQVAGVLKQGSFSGAFPLKTTTTTRLDLSFDQVRLTGLESLGVSGGTLSLGAVNLQGTGQGNSFRVEKLASSGGGLEVSGSGTLLLADSPARSRVNLNLVLQPSPTLDKGVKDLLDLFIKPGPDGSYRLQVTGSLQRPTVK